jgi:hypothetical protein
LNLFEEKIPESLPESDLSFVSAGFPQKHI